MSKRFIIVLCPSDPVKTDVAGRILKPFQEAALPDVELAVVCRDKFDFAYDGVNVIKVDDETASTDTKLRNYVIRKFYTEHGSPSAGWMYMMDEELEIIDAVGFEQFFKDLERMLDVFGMNAWLNTHTDSMNHVFEQYNPRFTVMPDDGVMDKVLGSARPVHWTSHANTVFMALNLSCENWERFLFNEEFAIPMYYIIDWICRQKEKNESLENPDFHWHWMNLYPTVDSEGGLFKLTEWKKRGLDRSSWREPKYRVDPGRDDFKREQELFDKYEHNFSFTANPDPMFKFMYNRFEHMIGKEKPASAEEKKETDNA